MICSRSIANFLQKSVLFCSFLSFTFLQHATANVLLVHFIVVLVKPVLAFGVCIIRHCISRISSTDCSPDPLFASMSASERQVARRPAEAGWPAGSWFVWLAQRARSTPTATSSLFRGSRLEAVRGRGRGHGAGKARTARERPAAADLISPGAAAAPGEDGEAEGATASLARCRERPTGTQGEGGGGGKQTANFIFILVHVIAKREGNARDRARGTMIGHVM